MFGPGRCTGHLRSCPFLGRQHTLRIGWTRLDAAMVVEEAAVVLIHEGVEHHFQERTSGSNVLWSIAGFYTESRLNPTARGCVSCRDKRMSGNDVELED